jgi:ADP-heptose:LPS heptosyltransferase
MHLVVDMQGTQAENRRHGLGGATHSLVKGILRGRGQDRVTLVFSALLPQSIDPIVNDLAGLVSEDTVRTWHGVGPVSAAAGENRLRSDVAEKIREAFLESLRPDVVLETGLNDGFLDDVVGSVGAFTDIPTAAFAAAESPLDHPDWQAWRQRRVESLSRCRTVFPPPADVSADAAAGRILDGLRALGSAPGPVSSLVNVDATGIFKPRRLRILVIKLDHLGDFLLSIPALSKLRAKYPHAEMDIVVGSWNAALARELNLFRNIHTYDFFKRQSSQTPKTSADELAAILARLDHYDIAIDLRRQPESRFLLVRTSADLKVGYQVFDTAVDERVDIMLRSHQDVQHVATQYNRTPISMQILRLIDALPGDINDYVRMPDIAAGVERRPGSVAIFPKAGTDVREWENRKFVELIDRLLANEAVTEVNVFFVNAQEAAEYGFGPTPKLAVHVGAPFSALTRLLAANQLCIANNSGGIHLASYLGLAVIGIYSGHELASEWGPQFRDSVAIHRGAYCAPCHLGRRADCPNGNFCLADISVDDVFSKATELLSGPTGSMRISSWRSDDQIVKALIASLAGTVDAADPRFLIDVANAIASNHPAYSLGPDGNFLTVNQVIAHNSTLIEWIGFAAGESQFRWSDGSSATMRFYLEGEEAPPANGRLLLAADTYRRQRIRAKFNGIPVFDRVLAGRRLLLDIPVSNLRLGRNELEFALPDAAQPANGDPRRLAIAVRRMKIAVDDRRQSVVVRHAARMREFLLRWKS